MGVKFDRMMDRFRRAIRKGERLDGADARHVDWSRETGWLYFEPSREQLIHSGESPFEAKGRCLLAEVSTGWSRRRKSWERAAIWIPASAAAQTVLTSGAKELGVNVIAVAKKPTGDSLKLRPIRIGLYDQYGGLMPSGWTRWIFEQYEFPFKVIYPQDLDAGDLAKNFDALVFTDGAVRVPGTGRGGGEGFGGRQPAADKHPGRVSALAWTHYSRKNDSPDSAVCRGRGGGGDDWLFFCGIKRDVGFACG